jgi:hypothetical protein
VFKWLLIAIGALIFFVVGSWWHTRYRAETALLEQPVYRIVKQHAPGVFHELLEEYLTYQRDEESRDRFINFANEKISGAATRALPRASQESVLALVRDMVSTAAKLRASPGDGCFQFWFPNIAGPPDVAHVIDADSQSKTLGLMAEVIRSAAENPAPPPDTEKVKDNLASIVNAVYAQYGADAQMLAHAEDPRIDRSRVCTITISLYERILQLPPADASDLIRTMAPAG